MSKKKECPDCGGKGKIEWSGGYGNNPKVSVEECKTCSGTGQVPDEK